MLIDIKESLHLITAKVNTHCYTEESVTAVTKQDSNIRVARQKPLGDKKAMGKADGAHQSAED